MSTDDVLQNSLIVAAHPDDEMLWFNAIVGRVDEVVIVYGDDWAQPGSGSVGAARWPTCRLPASPISRSRKRAPMAARTGPSRW